MNQVTRITKKGDLGEVKNITLKVVVVLAGIFSAAAAFSQDRVIDANVPFAFSVGNKVFPAGRYQIKPVGGFQAPAGILIRNIDHPNYGAIALISIDPSQGLPNQGSESHLIFDNSNGYHFLRAVRGPEGTVNAEFSVSKSENNLKRQKGAL